MNLFKKIASISWMPLALSLLGGLVYIFHAARIAQTKTSFLDEGLYLYKGYLFANGVYRPFQDFGPWTNHAILSFLIPGTIQKWFGPGLVTGRYAMIAISLITLLGLWIFARRWSGIWWATATVWVIALNPAEVKLYTLALTQGLVAVMLVWILVLTVGADRPLWQVLLGSSLTAALVLTRENMAFVPPLLFIYLIWQRGWKIGLLAALSAAIFFIIGNAFYFPDNLKFWATRVPRFLAPAALSAQRMRSSVAMESIPEPEDPNTFRRVLYFWLTFRLHFVALVSAVSAWLLWPLQFNVRQWTERTRAAIFISVLLVVLFAAHANAAFYGEFCISCILLYVAYFDFLGLMLFAILKPQLLSEVSPLRRAIIYIVMSIIVIGIAFSSYEDVSAVFANAMIDRLQDAYVWNVLLHFIKLNELMLFRITFVLLLSVILIALTGIGLWAARRFFNVDQAAGGRIGVVLLNGILIAGLILSPTKILGKGNDFFDCGGSNVFASYEKAGKDLTETIPAGSKIYWEGRELAIFLYVPDVKIYPPQMNQVHSFFIGGDPQTLLRYSFWNDKLAKQWLKEADYILIEKGEMQNFEKEILESGGYVKVTSTSRVEKCRWQSIIDVYRRADAKP